MSKMSLTDEAVYYTKENVSLTEYKIHKYVYNLHIVNIPKIKSYNKETRQLKMVRVGAMSISDYYGESAENIDDDLFTKIRNMIQTLYDHDILYVDITGYNFIENDKKLWIIDFEHATYNYPRKTDEFVEQFLEGHNGWNPEFL
jgi:tRNA A-37 threonylcarbamoyl transferase component Bud32